MTPEEQQALFDEHWPALKAALESGGGPAAVAYVQALEEGLHRRILFLFARQRVVMGDWEGKNLDAAVAVAQGGVAEMLAAAAESEEDERRRGLTNLANVISYNLAADLADCWPEDEAVRSQSHFQAGLQAADECVRWREELDNGPAALSMAWWAKGMHQLSLRDPKAARQSWTRSLEYAEEAADSDQDFSVVLGRGYRGLAAWIAGEEAGSAAFRDALATFATQLLDDERKEDARFGIDQLECVKARYGPDQPVE